MEILDACVFCCEQENDLYRTLAASGVSPKRSDSLAEAVTSCPEGGGILALADSYPIPRARASREDLARLSEREIRLYLEYPAECHGVQMTDPEEMGRCRLVCSAELGEDLPLHTILCAHAGWFLPVVEPSDSTSLLSLAKVAGYTEAVYGVPESAQAVLLVPPAQPSLLLATTKLSNFVTARYAPRRSWSALWQWILWWVTRTAYHHDIEWAPSVGPRYGPTDPVPEAAEETARRASVEWFATHAVFSIDWKKGAIEGFESAIDYQGRQKARTIPRGDCTGETALVFASDFALTANPASRHLAEQILDYVWSSPDFFQDNPRSPVYGLNNWNAGNPVFYGDDNARVILPTLAASALLRTDRWNGRMIRCLLANFRTTGPLGFRRPRLDLDRVVRDRRPWMFYHDAEYVHLAPHYQSYLWACLIWGYGLTGDRNLLERPTTAVRMTMDAYPDLKWTNGLTQEMARMLLPLSFLIRVQDNREYRAWLETIAHDLLAQMAPSGSIHELMGKLENGSYPSPRSNEDYGTSEASIIQENGDPACDLLYTLGYAFLGLHEAAAASGSAILGEAEDRLAAFLCRIQVVSENHPSLNGAWMRSFDDEMWEYWGSSSDLGWGAWSIETGWYNAWIASVLAFRHLGRTLFCTEGLDHVARDYPDLRTEMLQKRPFDPAAHPTAEQGTAMPGAE